MPVASPHSVLQFNYDVRTVLLQVLLMGPFNKLVLSWAQSLLWKERSDADVLDARLEASAEADPDGPPLSVTCGLE